MTLQTKRLSPDGAPQSARSWSSLTVAVLCTTLLLAAGGCGNRLANVSGTVTLDGEIVHGGGDVRATVYFNPTGSGGVAGVGLVDENGQYRLTTGSESGIPPGEYKVTFTATQLIHTKEAGGTPSGKRISPTRYAVASTSGLSCAVEPGSNTFDLTLTSAAP